MDRSLVTEEQVKNALKISDYNEMSKKKMKQFISLIPDMDSKVATEIINQFPSYSLSSILNNCVVIYDADDRSREGRSVYEGRLFLRRLYSTEIFGKDLYYSW